MQGAKARPQQVHPCTPYPDPPEQELRDWQKMEKIPEGPRHRVWGSSRRKQPVRDCTQSVPRTAQATTFLFLSGQSPHEE